MRSSLTFRDGLKGGLPITLVSAAITSMSFMGFGGLVENIVNALT